MREGSLNNFSTADPKWGSRSAQPDAKPLFWKILAASPSESRFYRDRARPPTHKSLRMNTLVDPEEKIVGGGGGCIDIRRPSLDGLLAASHVPHFSPRTREMEHPAASDQSESKAADRSVRSPSSAPPAHCFRDAFIPARNRRCGFCWRCSANRRRATSPDKTLGRALPPAALAPRE